MPKKPLKTAAGSSPRPAVSPRADEARIRSRETAGGAPHVPLLAVLGCLAIVGAVRMASLMSQGVAIDFYQFWAVAGAREVLPGENIYALETGERLARALHGRVAETDSQAKRDAADFRAERVDVVSTPFFYACFRAVRTGDYDTDLRRYRLVSLAAFIAALLIIASLIGCAPVTRLAALSFFLWAFPPLRFDLTEGNVNSMQLAVLALVLWLRREPDSTWRTAAAGFLLALAAMFKPNVAMVATLLLIGWAFLRRFQDMLRAALGAVSGVLIAWAASAWIMGTEASWRGWFDAVRHLERDFAVGIAQGNFGGAKLAGEALGWDPTLLFLAALLGIVAHRLWALRRSLPAAPADTPLMRDLDTLLIALGPSVAILGTSIAWPHYTILCIPLCLICLKQLEAEISFLRPPAMLATAALAGLSSTAWLGAVGVQTMLVQALGLALGVLALYIAGVRAFPQRNVSSSA